MSAEDLENYETDMELQLYREYRDVVGPVQLRRRNGAALLPRLTGRSRRRVPRRTGTSLFDVTLQDAWVWDMYRTCAVREDVRMIMFKDVNVEELSKSEDLTIPKDAGWAN